MTDAFSRRHPTVNLIFFVAAAVFAMLFNHPVFLGISFLAALCYAVKLKGKSAFRTFFFALLPLLVFVTLLNFLVNHYGVTVLYTFRSGNNLTLETIAYGAVTGALVVAMILWFMCYNEVVTEDKFMHVFGKRMPNAALLILMVLRFVPMYSKQLSETYAARKNAGLASDERKIDIIKNGVSSVSGVITWALEHSIETADSMKARGYGLKGRTNYSRFTFAPADFALLFVMLTLSAVIIAGKISGAADALYNPVIKIDGVSPMLVLSSIAYLIFCFLPLIYDWKEEMKWNRLYAKT